MNYIFLRDRKSIEKHIKFKQIKTSNVVNSKKEKDYEYFICDYCHEEIKIKDKKHEMTGGICIIPSSLTKRQAVKAVLHNKCLKAAIKELEG